MNISFLKDKSHIKVPKRASINFADAGIKKTAPWVNVVLAAILILFVAVFAKFLVVDRLNRLFDEQQKAAALENQVSEAEAKIESFGEIQEKYAHYTYSGMTAAEKALQDRMEIIAMLEKDIYGDMEPAKFVISGNTVNLSLTGATLQDINMTVQKLEQEDIVDYCAILNATTLNTEVVDEDVTGQIVIYLSDAEGGLLK